MALRKLRNVHPGEVLSEEFLVPLGISQNALARAIRVPPRRVNEIVLGKRSITADTAVRLARALGTSEGFWMGLQADYDLEQARAELADRLPEIERDPVGAPADLYAAREVTP
jgi:addiction module HigA family antidote